MIRAGSTSRQTDAAVHTVREAALRTLGIEHYPVQIQGGLAIDRGHIAEMQTGEGKTLTATLPAFLQASRGRQVFIATANDYLAQRDANWLRPLYARLGLTTGCIHSSLARDQRRAEYRCDIVYGTVSEFGFDYLRDRLEERRRHAPDAALASTPSGPVQPPPGFLLVDEADSLLIDEARTPLIISGPVGRADRAHAACYRWAARIAPQLHQTEHFVQLSTGGWPALTPAGRAAIRWRTMPPEIAPLRLTDIHHFIERALFVHLRYERDRHYVVRDGKIEIVDESTGRIQPGRTWNGGIHQAIEARENVPLTPETGHLARITIQEFVSRFPHVGGMTGTAREAARELKAVYGLKVQTIPTHRPCQRRILAETAFATRDEKWRAIVHETLEMRRQGRPVLIGTPAISTSMELSEWFRGLGVDHVVLNALNPEKEAGIIAAAGHAGRVTIATNRAGRGTDIALTDEVRAAGGLHVIGSELHAARRIDRQLAGRAARQGDPGSFHQLLSLEDDIIPAAWGTRAPSLIDAVRRKGPRAWCALLHRSQRQLQNRHLQQRRELLDGDDELRKRILALGLDPELDAIE